MMICALQINTIQIKHNKLRVSAYKNRPKPPINGTSQKIDFACILPIDSKNRNGPYLVSANTTFFGRNMQKTISPRLGSKSTSGFAECPEYLIASRSAEQLLENLSMDFIFSVGLPGMTERKVNKSKLVFSPKRDQTDTKFYNVLQANYCIKTSPYFSMGYNFKYHKNAFYGLNIHRPVRISKNISGQMALSRSPWPVFLIDFAQNPLLECKQLRDTDSHFRVNIRFQQSYESNF